MNQGLVFLQGRIWIRFFARVASGSGSEPNPVNLISVSVNPGKYTGVILHLTSMENSCRRHGSYYNKPEAYSNIRLGEFLVQNPPPPHITELCCKDLTFGSVISFSFCSSFFLLYHLFVNGVGGGICLPIPPEYASGPRQPGNYRNWRRTTTGLRKYKTTTLLLMF